MNPPSNNFPLIPVIIAIILTGVVVGSGVFWLTNQKQDTLRTTVNLPSPSTPSDTSPSPISTPPSQSDLNRVFELDKKQPGTKLYYSDTLGVGFTYVSALASNPVKITESGNTIDISGQTIEVFTKDPKFSLKQAIEDRFLQGYKAADCFVKTSETSEQQLARYVSAEISFPITESPDEPWWKNSEKCPQRYSQTNGVQYFLMNKDVPGKFLFLRLGQEAVAYDGTSRPAAEVLSWSHSVRILK